ncbi:MAG: UDP-glucose 4-epimerase GalE [Alphaproteobacteria bacterium]|nr:UDP-glucose 4-epimerase GalE [Alphaproteobacteria bacterium]
MRTLVTGGAGYIGSHVVLALAEGGHEAVVLDNLSTGHAWAVKSGTLVKGDIADAALLDRLFTQHRFEAVIHLAAESMSSESVAEPLRYYRSNVLGTHALLAACQRHTPRWLVFSSSAAVYGAPRRVPVTERAAIAPINPYGASKAMGERMIADLCASAPLKAVSLRFFNVAVADPDGRAGESTPVASHLIKIAAEVVTGKRSELTLFGQDYPTPDGTCIRDYVHVNDVAHAHLDALAYLQRGGVPRAFNLGYGQGASVKEVIRAVERATGKTLPRRMAERRSGDAPRLVADGTLARKNLGWTPRYDDLDRIVTSALAWERGLAARIAQHTAP